MKYGRKKEFVDAEIEARMGIDNLSQIEKAAKNDPTVSKVLLDEKKSPDEIPAPKTEDIPNSVTEKSKQ